MEKRPTKEGLLALFSHAPIPTNQHNQACEALPVSFRDLLLPDVVSTDLSARTLTDQFLNSKSSEEPVAFEDYIRYLVENVVSHSVNMASPRCLGHMTSMVPNFMLTLGNIILQLNQNLVKREASKTFTLLERQTIAMVHRLVYNCSDRFYDENVQNEARTLGIMTTGGTLANITALWIARNSCFASSNGFSGIEQEGLNSALNYYGYKSAVIIGSSLMHYSLEKAASLLGLGCANLIAIPVDAKNRMSITALRKTVAECLARKQRIIAIVGVAGTTDYGSIDPLSEIADLAQEVKVHFHVDAAWGAPILFSRRHKNKLLGIERADSVTMDGHKQLYLPIGTSMLLLRQPQAAEVIEKQSHYMLREGSGDLGQRSLEGSRAGTALFVHAALNVIGRGGYEFLVNENFRKTKAMAELIKSSPEFELLAEPETNIILYRYIPEPWRAATAQGKLTGEENRQINSFNEKVQQIQYEAGRTFVSRTTLNGTLRATGMPIVALRAVIANPLINEEDLQKVLEDQIRIASEIS